MNTNHHLRKNHTIYAFREFIMNFIGKWKPPPSHGAARHRRGAPMRRNRVLGNLFHNLSASKFFLMVATLFKPSPNAAETKINSNSQPLRYVVLFVVMSNFSKFFISDPVGNKL